MGSKQYKTNSYTEFYYHFFRNILVVVLPFLVISAFILGFSVSRSSATNSGSDSVTLTLSTSCTLSSSVITPHNASLNGGQYEEGIGDTRINTYCNDNNGYSIYAIGTSNNVGGNTDLVSDLDEHYNIHTGAYTNGNNIDTSTPSFWGMKLTPGAGTGSISELTPPTIMNSYNSYNAVPSSYTLVASRTSGTNMTIDTDITGSYFNTTYNIYASSVQPAGSYEGRVKYVMVHPSNNSHNTIPDLEAAFAAAGKQKTYQEDTAGNYYYAMQDMNPTICASVTRKGEATATQLVDRRDNKLYWVAKLDDDKCWMTSNLDLDIGGVNTATLNSNNTDISTDPNVYTSSGIYSDYSVSDGVYTWNPVSTAKTSSYYIDNTSVKPSAWPVNNYITPYSAEGGDTYYYTSNSTSNDTRYNSLKACKDADHNEAECKRYFAGNYYNWSAAIASNNSTNINTNNRATNSICPKGWRLPNASQTDNEYNEFGRMLYKAGITAALSAGNDSVGYKDGGFNKIRSNPYYFVRSGRISGGTLGNPGFGGYFWSSTVSSSTDAYYLDFNSTDIYPARSYYRYHGRPVRCVSRSTNE